MLSTIASRGAGTTGTSKSDPGRPGSLHHESRQSAQVIPLHKDRVQPTCRTGVQTTDPSSVRQLERRIAVLLRLAGRS